MVEIALLKHMLSITMMVLGLLKNMSMMMMMMMMTACNLVINQP